jgi:glycosyltransferase involved in cell wall biosynthesis
MTRLRIPQYLRFLQGLPQAIWSTKSPYSELIFVSDGYGWSIDHDAIELRDICGKFAATSMSLGCFNPALSQSMFFTSRQTAIRYLGVTRSRVALPYYHGRPSLGKSFAMEFKEFSRMHENISRVQVTNTRFESIVLESGIDESKVFRIPIGIRETNYRWTTPSIKAQVRKSLGLPNDAVIVGSFQKDGMGWGEGCVPKLEKGPDVFLKVIEMVARQVPELFVLLTGPARGYVKNGLKKIGVPYSHFNLRRHQEVGVYYNALDAYLVTSREEGGPKAILESMASGIPLVTTSVGQAIDLVKHQDNGWMEENNDTEGLAHWLTYAINRLGRLDDVLQNGAAMVDEHSYSNQVHLWREFMNGFVDVR